MRPLLLAAAIAVLALAFLSFERNSAGIHRTGEAIERSASPGDGELAAVATPVELAGTGLGEARQEVAAESIPIRVGQAKRDTDRTVLLKIRDAGGIAPVAGAKVLAINTRKANVWESFADEHGELRIRAGDGISYVISGGSHVPIEIHPVNDESVGSLVVALGGFASLSGQVSMDGEFKVSVAIIRIPAPASASVRDPEKLQLTYGKGEKIATARCDADGFWEVPRIGVYTSGEGAQTYFVKVTSNGASRWILPGFSLAPGQSRVVADPWGGVEPVEFEFAYPSGTTLAGGVKVTMTPRGDRVDPMLVSTGTKTTDPNGRVRVRTEPGSQWTIQLGKSKPFEVEASGRSPHRVTLEGYGCVAGTLVDEATGEVLKSLRLEELQVRANPAPGTSAEHLQELRLRGPLLSSAQGCFRFDLMPVGLELLLDCDHLGAEAYLTTREVALGRLQARAGDEAFELPLLTHAPGTTAYEEFKSAFFFLEIDGGDR